MTAKTAAAILLATCAAASALDLTPIKTQVRADGLVLSAVCFKDGEKRVFIQPPHGWTIEGRPRIATLTHDVLSSVSVTFVLSKSLLPPDGDARRREARDIVLRLLPQASQNVTVDSETPDPVRLNGWHSYGVRVSYDFDGQRLTKSVSFIRLNNNEELRVNVTGAGDKFAMAAGAAATCLATWHKE
jgi:hypothetical protein